MTEKPKIRNLQDVKPFYSASCDEVMLVHQPYTAPGNDVKLDAFEATAHVVAAAVAWVRKRPLGDDIHFPLLNEKARKLWARITGHRRLLEIPDVRETLLDDRIVRVTVEVYRPSRKEWAVIREARREIEMGEALGHEEGAGDATTEG